ncbi:MAG: hypothetical protein KC448_06250 [Yoonia sp.]|nr:hypothetical protein [Yoonia sp.]
MQEALGNTPNMSEKQMFGGLCVMLNGHMVCGVHKDGGMVDVSQDVLSDHIGLKKIVSMAPDYAKSLPPK